MKKKNNRLMKIAIGMSILAVCTVLLAAGLFMAKRMEEEHATPQDPEKSSSKSIQSYTPFLRQVSALPNCQTMLLLPKSALLFWR